MRFPAILTIATVVGLIAGPALAADAMSSGTMKPAMKSGAMAMSSMSMMKGGEVMAFMPDGQMGKMVMSSKDKEMMDGMMKMATPLSSCVLIMQGTDGKSYMVDTSSKMAMDECEKIAK